LGAINEPLQTFPRDPMMVTTEGEDFMLFAEAKGLRVGGRGLPREAVGEELLATGEEAGREQAVLEDGIPRRRQPVEADQHQRGDE